MEHFCPQIALVSYELDEAARDYLESQLSRNGRRSWGDITFQCSGYYPAVARWSGSSETPPWLRELRDPFIENMESSGELEPPN